jgi:hypothetical protein
MRSVLAVVLVLTLPTVAVAQQVLPGAPPPAPTYTPMPPAPPPAPVPSVVTPSPPLPGVTLHSTSPNYPSSSAPIQGTIRSSDTRRRVWCGRRGHRHRCRPARDM